MERQNLHDWGKMIHLACPDLRENFDSTPDDSRSLAGAKQEGGRAAGDLRVELFRLDELLPQALFGYTVQQRAPCRQPGRRSRPSKNSTPRRAGK